MKKRSLPTGVKDLPEQKPLVPLPYPGGDVDRLCRKARAAAAKRYLPGEDLKFTQTIERSGSTKVYRWKWYGFPDHRIVFFGWRDSAWWPVVTTTTVTPFVKQSTCYCTWPGPAGARDYGQFCARVIGPRKKYGSWMPANAPYQD